MRSPLFSGLVYFLLGVIFTYFAIQSVSAKGWNFLAYMLIFIATIDFGVATNLVRVHFKLKNK